MLSEGDLTFWIGTVGGVSERQALQEIHIGYLELPLIPCQPKLISSNIFTCSRSLFLSIVSLATGTEDCAGQRSLSWYPRQPSIGTNGRRCRRHRGWWWICRQRRI